MDRLLYVAMNGAKSMFDRQNQVAHNLANVSTAGYRAETMAFRALPVEGPGRHTRTFVVDSTTGTDFSIGPMRETGRVFDVALDGKGFIAVRGADGKEAYTRDGALQLGRNGVLETKNGLQVLTDAGGTIVIPPDNTITVGRDGTISAIPMVGIPNTATIVGRIKLVNPAEKTLQRGTDGLFRQESGRPAPADAGVRLTSGMLEGSNVNAVEAITSIISVARQYDTQVRLMQSADQNARGLSQLLTLNA
ncbi:MAG: flagellar basal-body rod protein FlgF [Betaproteobacteria bacterium]|nr:flagellar basal-body rod protein FlgF [Betaproteobacteria bacterium]